MVSTDSGKRNRRAVAVSWVLCVLCMGAIFWFSSRTASESTAQSDVFVEWLMSLFGESALWVFIVRKSAHCLEFTGLSLLFNTAWYFTRERKSVLLAVACTSLYAVTDELHQLFVDGRSCELRDWAIDTLGAVLGALGFLVLLALTQKIIHHRQQKRKKQ
ncbi:MAG: VanZ family protein [Eubacterium sp.]|nr:VanZ family protein [Eubacterium sp.]